MLVPLSSLSAWCPVCYNIPTKHLQTRRPLPARAVCTGTRTLGRVSPCPLEAGRPSPRRVCPSAASPWATSTATRTWTLWPRCVDVDLPLTYIGTRTARTRLPPRIRTCQVPLLDEVGLYVPVYICTIRQHGICGSCCTNGTWCFCRTRCLPPPPPVPSMLQEGGAAGNVIYVLGMW